jgi:hypothetical protein
MRIRGPLGSVALALGSLAAVLFLLEAVSRAHVKRIEGPPGTTRFPLARYDSELGWAKPEGEASIIQRREYRVPIEINAKGLRGPDRAYEKRDGVHRTLLLGDSITEGYSVAEHMTLRALLEGRLNAQAGAEHEVLNGGTAGYSTDQEYLFYLREGARYAPDDVVLLFCYNDVLPMLGGEGGKPFFEIEDDALVLRNVPVPPPLPGASRDVRRPYTLKPWRGSYALRLLSDRTSSANPELHGRLERLGLTEPLPDRAPPPEMRPYQRSSRPDVAEAWRRVDAVIAALKHDVTAAGGKHTLFYVPTRFEVNDRAWDRTRRRYRLGQRWDRDLVFEEFRVIAGRHGLPLTDPRPAFRQAEAAGIDVYFPQDGHWTEAGNALAAAELEAELFLDLAEVTRSRRRASSR